MTKAEFFLKISINIISLLTIVLYIFCKHFFNKKFLYPIIDKEKELISKGQLDIKEVQDNSWAKNLDEVTSFSSISIAIILIVVAYLIEKNLPYYKELYFKIILFIISISAVSYTISIQLYNNAISKMPSKVWTLKQRRFGVTFQVIGWYGLIASIIFCIMLVDIYLGAICNLYTVISVIIVYEINAKKN